MKIVCLHKDENDAAHELTIVGSTGDEHIVMIGSWRRQVSSFEAFKIDKSLYYVDDETQQTRVLVTPPLPASRCFSHVSPVPQNLFYALRSGWRACTPYIRRCYALSLLKRFYFPVLLGILVAFFIANSNLTKVALAPSLEIENRNREFVYLAIDEFVRQHPAKIETQMPVVKARPAKVVRPTVTPSCKTIIIRKSSDSDVRKFLSPRFAKTNQLRTTRCL